MSRPLIVLDALLLRPCPTGVGRAIIEWTRALADEDHGLDFVVLCTHADLLPDLQGRPGWRLLPCPGATGGMLRKAAWTQFVMPGVLRRLGADLMHSMQFVAPMVTPCPTVVTVHDLGYLRFPETIEEPRRSYYRTLVPPSLRRAGAVVCNSAATADDVRLRFPAVADRVEVTPFGTPSWVLEQPSHQEQRGVDGPFLFVGTLEPRKNLERLLRAYQDFVESRGRRQLKAPKLVLVGGRGWKDSRLRDILAPLAESGQVIVKDYCGPQELWEQSKLARALLFPSLHEGFGFPILEAMVAGLPVLTSDDGAMAEVAGDAALTVNSHDQEALTACLERLVDEPSLLEDLVRRGQERWTHWTWAQTARSTVKIYRQLLARP